MRPLRRRLGIILAILIPAGCQYQNRPQAGAMLCGPGSKPCPDDYDCFRGNKGTNCTNTCWPKGHEPVDTTVCTARATDAASESREAGAAATGGTAGGSGGIRGVGGGSGGAAPDGGAGGAISDGATGGNGTGGSGTGGIGGSGIGGAGTGGRGTGGSGTGGVAGSGIGGSGSGGRGTGGSGVGGSCGAGLTACGSACVDTRTDRSHCGGCSTVCEGYQYCRGKCVPQYQSTTVLPFQAAASFTLLAITSAVVTSADDLVLNAYILGGSLTLATGISAYRDENGGNEIVRYTSSGNLFWMHDVQEVFPGGTISQSPSLVLSDNGDIVLSDGDGHRLARVAAGSGSLVWSTSLASQVNSVGVVPRRGRGDFLIIDSASNPGIALLVSGDGKTITPLSRNTSTASSAANSFVSALSASDGTTWLWGKQVGTVALDPFSSMTWNIPGFPSFIVGDTGGGIPIGPWFSEGQSGPYLSLVDTGRGDLFMLASASGPTRINGQDLSSGAGVVFARFDPTAGRIKWVQPTNINGLTQLLLAPSGDAMIVGPNSVSFLDGTNGAALSSWALDAGTSAQVAVGAATAYLLGSVSKPTDFDPGSAMDVKGDTSGGLFISKFSF